MGEKFAEEVWLVYNVLTHSRTKKTKKKKKTFTKVLIDTWAVTSLMTKITPLFNLWQHKKTAQQGEWNVICTQD